eukprot:2309527-Rhodomonas_salina.2
MSGAKPHKHPQTSERNNTRTAKAHARSGIPGTNCPEFSVPCVRFRSGQLDFGVEPPKGL